MVLDALIPDGPARARAGQMSKMAAGTDQAFSRARAVLDVLSSQVFRIRPNPDRLPPPISSTTS